mmetsp:Transcript_75869/g.217133  ORF Transcript_75869/g.217133 Transcript_75869/m.217133 type:complete len:156 (+) Transcript_75869:650-1117(+)
MALAAVFLAKCFWSNLALLRTRASISRRRPWTWPGPLCALLAGPQFHESTPDLFVCQQVIQHFPSIAYFETFLANVDASGAQDVMLHFRQSKDGKTAAGGAYANSAGAVRDVSLALLTTVAFISERLLHYELSWTVSKYMSLGYNGTFSGWRRKV